MSKTSYFVKQIDSCFEKQNYYEAHQIYRTIYYRLSARGFWAELQELLYNGALRLIEVNEPTSAMDLAELYIQVLTKGCIPVSTEILNRFQKLFSSLSSTLKKDTAADGQKVDRRSQFLSQAVKWSMSVAEKKSYKQKGHAALHSCVAKVLWQEGNYCAARNHFLVSDEPETFAECLVEFQLQRGDDSDKDALALEAVLQLLCSKRPRTALLVLQKYCEKHPDVSSVPPYNFPLLNFARYLLLAIRAKKVEYFTRLLEIFGFNKDSSYIRYLDRIGQIYLEVPPPDKQSSFLGSFIKGLVGTGQSDAKSEAVSGVGDELSDEEQFFDERTEQEKKELLEILHSAHSSQIVTASGSQNSQIASLQTAEDLDLD